MKIPPKKYTFFILLLFIKPFLMSKTWIIPDIHGCVATLQMLMEQQIKPDKTDHLVFLGDYIDRGPDTKGVLDFIMHLQQEEYHISALRGNHEESCIKAWHADKRRKSFVGFKTKSNLQKEWENFGGKQTLKSFGATFASEIPEKYIRWMESLEYFVEADKFVAVHAGLNFNIDDPFSDTQSMLWIREFRVDPQKIQHKILIHGHVPVNLELIDMAVKNPYSGFIDLDNGIYMTNKAGFGNLVTLEAESMEYKVQTVVDNVKYDKPF
jgi:serine/threonine protein phosphatase 1